jgi:hypothetical protein
MGGHRDNPAGIRRTSPPSSTRTTSGIAASAIPQSGTSHGLRADERVRK